MSMIDPSQIPGADLDPESVRTGAGGLSKDGGTIRDHGAAVLRDWQRLPASFAATGIDALYTAMAPVGTTTDAIGDSLDGIAKALTAYATTVEPIKAELDRLRGQAVRFVAKAKAFTPQTEMVTDGGYSLWMPQAVQIDSWDQDPALNDENNGLISDVARQEAAWLDAQQTCANAIRAAVGLARTGVAAERALAAQLRSDDQLQTAWGTTADRHESCSEKANTFGTHFLWDGVIVGFGWNTLKGVGALLGVDPTGKSESEIWNGFWSGDWDLWWKGQGDALKQWGATWTGVGHLASGLVVNPMVAHQLLDSPLADWIPDDVRRGLQDWNDEDGTVLYGSVAALVGLTLPTRWYDPNAYKDFNVAQSWVDNPGGTAGTSAATIASFFIPGAGEAKAAGLAGDAGKVADGARAAELGEGGAAGLKGLDGLDGLKGLTGAEELGAEGLSRSDLAGITDGLKGAEPGADALAGEKASDFALPEPERADTPAGSTHEAQAPAASDAEAPVQGSHADEAVPHHSAGAVERVETEAGGDTGAGRTDQGADTASGDTVREIAPAPHEEAQAGGAHDAPAETAIDTTGAVGDAPVRPAADGGGGEGADARPVAEGSSGTGDLPAEIGHGADADAAGGAREYSTAFFGDSNLHYYLGVLQPTLGAPGGSFFVMPAEDGAVVRDAGSAARYTGMSPSTFDAYTKGGDVYGIAFPKDGIAHRVPVAADATYKGTVWEHFLDGGHTAVRLEGPKGGFLVNPTRELVIAGGTRVPPGSVLFRVGRNAWEVLQRW